MQKPAFAIVSQRAFPRQDTKEVSYMSSIGDIMNHVKSDTTTNANKCTKCFFIKPYPNNCFVSLDFLRSS